MRTHGKLRPAPRLCRPLRLEPLESRQLLSGDPLEISPFLTYPKFDIDSGPGTHVSYDAGTQILELQASVLGVAFDGAGNGAFLFDPATGTFATMTIRVQTDALGTLIGGAPGDDFSIRLGSTTYLAGEILPDAFGFENTTAFDSVAQFVFVPTDGTYAGLFGAFGSVGVSTTLSGATLYPGSSFSFAQPGLTVKGVAGLIPPAGAPDIGKISGFVFDDCGCGYCATSNNGIKETGEDPIAGVLVTLWRLNTTTGLYEQVGTQLTGADGSYSFNNLPLGTYRVTETQPAGYLDGTDAKEGVPLPHAPYTADTDTISGIVLDATKTTSANNNFGELEPASISGYVYNDINNDGCYNPTIEDGIGGVTIKLERLMPNGTWVLIDTTTTSTVPDSGTTYTEGSYAFTGLYPGTYRVTEVQPADWRDGKDTVGTLGGMALCNDQFKLTLKCGQDGTKYNFGEIGILHGLTGTIGFWANKNGQRMIKLFNADSYTLGTSKLLGNWLATNFPNLYGSGAGANCMAGKTTAQIAARFVQLKDASGQKLDAQVLAVCFAIYTTTRELNTSSAGIGFAAQHGFVSPIPQADSSNLRNRKWDLDENGDAFASKTIINKITYYFTADDNTALPADGTLTVWTLLQRTNMFASAGVLWASGMTVIDTDGTSRYFTSAELRNEANYVFSDINESGDIIS